MENLKMVKGIFLVAAIFDITLGIIFALFFKRVYNSFGYPLPNHDAYVQLPALYVLIFGIAFYLVYRDPVQNRAIMPVGILMKLAFSAVCLGHMFFGAVASFYIPLAVIDLIFAGLFAWALKNTGRLTPAVKMAES